jgi:hypothetical protein
LRAKIPQLRLALQGKIREHHRFSLKRLLHQLRFIENEIDLLEQRLEELTQQDPTLADAVARWTTVLVWTVRPPGAWQQRSALPWRNSPRQHTWRAGLAGNSEGADFSGRSRSNFNRYKPIMCQTTQLRCAIWRICAR